MWIINTNQDIWKYFNCHWGGEAPTLKKILNLGEILVFFCSHWLLWWSKNVVMAIVIIYYCWCSDHITWYHWPNIKVTKWHHSASTCCIILATLQQHWNVIKIKIITPLLDLKYEPTGFTIQEDWGSNLIRERKIVQYKFRVGEMCISRRYSSSEGESKMLINFGV